MSVFVTPRSETATTVAILSYAPKNSPGVTFKLIVIVAVWPALSELPVAANKSVVAPEPVYEAVVVKEDEVTLTTSKVDDPVNVDDRSSVT